MTVLAGLWAAWPASAPRALAQIPDLVDGSVESAISRHHRLAAEVEASFDELTRRMERAFDDLARLLAEEAPELFHELEEPPVVFQPGYQVLPQLLPDEAAPSGDSRLFFNSYSWPRTRALIADRLRVLAYRLERPLEQPPPEDEEEIAIAWAGMVADYKLLREDHIWIEGLIEHNRLWQGEIANDPDLFALGTLLHGLAVERQRILDELAAESPPDASSQAPGAHQVTLRSRERKILEELRSGRGRTWIPDYLRVQRPTPGVRTVAVTLFTDVKDAQFLERFRNIIERYWRYEDGDVLYRVELSVTRLQPDQLYLHTPGDRPEPGQAVDVVGHTALFPTGGAVLTTGGEKIHTRGRHIVLGPEAVAPRTLAHEFGHVLGFRDEYVRGYRDLGEDGYEILEASPDPEDIMCSSGTGRVHRYHFEALIPPES